MADLFMFDWVSIYKINFNPFSNFKNKKKVELPLNFYSTRHMITICWYLIQLWEKLNFHQWWLFYGRRLWTERGNWLMRTRIFQFQ